MCPFMTKRKIICKRHIQGNVCRDKRYKCPICDKKYSDKSNLNKHYKRFHNSTETPQVSLEHDSKEDAKVLYVPINDSGDIVNILPLGSENLDYFDDRCILRLLSLLSVEGCDGIVAAASIIHFDLKHPENHNITVTDPLKRKLIYKDKTGFTKVHGKRADDIILLRIIHIGFLIEEKWWEFIDKRGVLFDPFDLAEEYEDVFHQSIVGMKLLLERIKERDPTQEQYDFFYELLFKNSKNIIKFY
jgi:Zinc finger, C2H2 type